MAIDFDSPSYQALRKYIQAHFHSNLTGCSKESEITYTIYPYPASSRTTITESLRFFFKNDPYYGLSFKTDEVIWIGYKIDVKQWFSPQNTVFTFENNNLCFGVMGTDGLKRRVEFHV